MKRGQMKVQEMAFVLVALMIFFALVALLYISFRNSSLHQSAREVSDERAQAAIRVLAAAPEIAWSECKGCVDEDKLFLLKERLAKNVSVRTLSQYDYIALDIIYPPRTGGECMPGNYPFCNHTTVLKERSDYGIAFSSFVTACHWDATEREICELGTLSLSDRGGERAP